MITILMAFGMGSPPTSCCKSVGETKRTEDICGYEIEDGAGGSCANGSGCIRPLLVCHRCATVRIRNVYIWRQRTSVFFFRIFFDSVSRLAREDGRKNASSMSAGSKVMVFLLGTSLLREIIILFKRDGRIVESAHLGASISYNALATELTLFICETRVAAIKGHSPDFRHVV